jgi:hypothetical protein
MASKKLKDNFKEYLVEALQKVGVLRQVEENGSSQEMRDIASEGIKVLFDDFINTLVDHLNESEESIEEILPVSEAEGKYYLDDDTTIKEFKRHVQDYCDPEGMKSDLIRDLKTDGINMKFE